jgi:hypothetical protein
MGMKPNERIARDLAKRLVAVGVPARVQGAGVHWHVDVGPIGTRALVVHCCWYDRALSGLMLGMNPANQRKTLRATRQTYEGPEYVVIAREGDTRIMDGRTKQPADAVACARAWLAGGDRERLAGEVPFLDQKGRAIRALAARLDPRLRQDVGGDFSYDELWVYGDDRSCRVIPRDDATSFCEFSLGQATVAESAEIDDIPGAVAVWLIEGVPLRALAVRVAGVMLERHAEVLETDPARWHWLHVHDRIADDHDVLAPLRPLIETLAASPVATAFYTYSSLNGLCFPASSHFPWVVHGLPVVCPAKDGACFVATLGRETSDGWYEDMTRCHFPRAATLIEEMLAAAPVRPFFGSEPHYDLPLLAACFARQGSTLRPRLVQRRAWYDVIVSDDAGARSCRIGVRHATFEDGAGRLTTAWGTIDDTVRAVCRYLEEGATLDAIAADADGTHGSRG